MKRTYIAIGIGLCAAATLSLATGTTASAAVTERIIGQWDWGATDADNPLANTVTPGTYDATPHNDAAVSSGVITIENLAQTNTAYYHRTQDHFFDVGIINELNGTRYFRWEFDNVTFSDWDDEAQKEKSFVLAGARDNNNVFGLQLQLRRTDELASKTALWYLQLYGKNKDGAATSENAINNSGIKMVPDTAYDLQYIYEVTGNGQDATASATFKVREHDVGAWTTVTSLNAPATVVLNALNGPVYLGKYSAGSTVIGDETIGTTTLSVAVPEPASLGLIGMGVLGLLARRRR